MANPTERREVIKRIRNTVTIGDMVSTILTFHKAYVKSEAITACPLCMSKRPYHVSTCPMVKAFQVSNQVWEEESKE